MKQVVLRIGLALAPCAALLAGCERPLAPAERVNVKNVRLLKEAFGGDAVAAAAAAETVAAEPTGWATIRGRFVLNGDPPPRQPLVVDKEQDVCAPGGKQVLSEQLVVDPATKGIKDVVIYLTTKYPDGDSKWEHDSYAADRESEVEFDQKQCVFLSHVFGMRSTQKCKVLNSDPVGHNTNISGGGKAKPENVTIAGNAYAIYEPGGESPEPFAVACNIHPWMSARMIVRNNPYFAITNPDGTFEIPNVPAGVDLEFRLWQEKAGSLSFVTLNGQQTKVPKKGLKLKLEDGVDQTLDFVVDVAAFNK
jgi:hypothetical protein